MILVDTSVWVDHLRSADNELKPLLEANLVATHAYVIAELALGTLKNRALVLQLLGALPSFDERSSIEVINFIEQNAVFGRGIGYVDANLLATVHHFQARLMTRDKRLRSLAAELGLSAD